MTNTFSQYLIENETHKNHALLILQKIIDMVDDGYVDYDADKIVINIGKLIKNKEYYDLDIIIRRGTIHSVRLAKSETSNNYAIIIETTRLPTRSKIDSFLSKKGTVDKFTKEFQKYISKYHKTNERDAITSYEKGKEINSRSNFEKQFKELSQTIKDKLVEYKSAKENIEREIKNSGTPGRSEVLKLSLENLKNEYLGSNAKEFVSKMLKLTDKNFVDLLEKSLKTKLINRLTSYYEHEIA